MFDLQKFVAINLLVFEPLFNAQKNTSLTYFVHVLDCTHLIIINVLDCVGHYGNDHLLTSVFFLWRFIGLQSEVNIPFTKSGP